LLPVIVIAVAIALATLVLPSSLLMPSPVLLPLLAHHPCHCHPERKIALSTESCAKNAIASNPFLIIAVQ
jgi:hypothetical protein